MKDAQEQDAHLQIDRDGDALVYRLSGRWKLGKNLPEFDQNSDLGGAHAVAFDLSKVDKWDTGLIAFLLQGIDFCEANKLSFHAETLPDSVHKLVCLALEVPEKKDMERLAPRHSVIYNMGQWGIDFCAGCKETLQFVGECCLSLLRLATGRTRLRWRDFFVILQQVGAEALPIVLLIGFLIGLIIAFLGAGVLSQLGAEYYVSYLVGLGMLREMGAVMTAVIMAGRTGAAFAAQIGSMKVTEEIDALKTLGISPIDFIVLPRILALFLMMPFLTIFADVIGIFGGIIVSDSMLDISAATFLTGMREVVVPLDFYLGVFKGTVFGVLIAMSGCFRGMQCGNSSDAVGVAATSAVVTGITLIIIANTVIDWIAAIYGF